jgi:hypothetical protein
MNNSHELFWQAFALSGDPLAYLDYTRNRSEWHPESWRRDENNESTGLGA